MTTKTRPSHVVTARSVDITYSASPGSDSHSTFTYATGSDTISYADGPRSPNGRWPWKECSHVKVAHRDPIVSTIEYVDKNRSNGGLMTYHGNIYDLQSGPRLPSGNWDPKVCQGILDQLDLNKGESVLLYSGVLQAIPLLGGALKFTSVLNKAARNLSKSFKKKPFTTVVKSLISMDFIDRFVISPTIDDARKFQDATDYVLRTLQTARDRNEHTFALESTVKTVISRSERTRSMNNGGYSGTLRVKEVSESYIEDKAFALCRGKYNLTAEAPLKLWARRVGLTRPLDSVWDLVPFSFVIDYFTRAGDFISALSDEMSSVDGLSGTMVKVLDLWGTHKRRAHVTIEPVGWVSQPSKFWNDDRIVGPTYTKGRKSIIDNVAFDRFRIPNPWGILSSLQQKVSDYLTIDLSPSSTQKRTIAELIIQAKL